MYKTVGNNVKYHTRIHNLTPQKGVYSFRYFLTQISYYCLLVYTWICIFIEINLNAYTALLTTIGYLGEEVLVTE